MTRDQVANLDLTRFVCIIFYFAFCSFGVSSQKQNQKIGSFMFMRLDLKQVFSFPSFISPCQFLYPPLPFKSLFVFGVCVILLLLDLKVLVGRKLSVYKKKTMYQQTVNP